MCIFASEDAIRELFGKEAECPKLRKAFQWCLAGESKTVMELTLRKENSDDSDYVRTLFFKALFFEENAWHKRTQIDCRRLRVLEVDDKGQYLAIPPENNLPDKDYLSIQELIGEDSQRLSQALFRLYECTRIDYFGTASKAQVARWAVLAHRDNSDNMHELLDIVFEGRDMEHTAIEFLGDDEASIVFPAMKAASLYKTVMKHFDSGIEPGEFNLLSKAVQLSEQSDVLKVTVPTHTGDHDLGKDPLCFAKEYYNMSKEQGMFQGIEFFDSTPAEWLMHYIVLAGR